ncbi:hypothetical protein H8E77_30160 [bacterium]|nr:hypothetical protein [bacterium]
MKPVSFIILCSLSIALGFSLISSPIAYGKVLWKDDFEDGKIDGKYEMMNHPGKWVEEDGVIKQTDPAPGDHTYLIIPGDFPEPHTGVVMIRIDDWADHDLSRAGIGFRLDPGDGSGYAFLIHNTLNNMEFLNDHLAWKQNDTPPPFDEVEIGKWYWMKAEVSDKEIKGKIWPEEEKEPTKWLLESAFDFGGLRGPSGRAGLNGGSNAGAGKTLVSFDNFVICEKTDECKPELFMAVETTDKLSTTWGKLKNSY